MKDLPKMKLVSCIVYLSVISLLSCSTVTEEIKVTDFGAIPNDSIDDTQSIQNAVAACKNKKNPILVFQPGEYDIYGSQKNKRGNYEPSLVVRDIRNLTIIGEGAGFTGHNNSTLFHFINCSNIKISNLFVDWNPLPYTQGQVVKVDSNYIDIGVTGPFTAKEGLRTEAVLGYDPEHQRMARRFTDHYQLGYKKTTEVPLPGIMRLFISRSDRFAGTMPSVGMSIIARHQVYGYQSFEFNKCNDVQIENVTIFSNPGMGIMAEECHDIHISHLKVMIKPGSGRWMSCTADATHFAGCRGTLTMENCLFEGMGDDATNVRSGHYLLVSDRLDNNRLRIKAGYRYGSDLTPPEIGDKLELSGEDKPLLSYATITVRSVEKDTIDKSLLIGFSEKLPERTGKGDVVGNASSIPALWIRNCTTIRNRSRGFIIKTRNVVIEDCTFQDITECGVALESDINGWWESISSRDVIIRNNRFIDSKFEAGYLHGVIEFHTMSQTAPAGVYRRITIANNVFLNSAGNIIKVGSADGVDISNNIMDHPEEEAISLYNSRNIRITGNILSNCKTGLKIGEGCDTATIRLKNNSGI
jgi:parallel beta-helix repeat protein